MTVTNPVFGPRMDRPDGKYGNIAPSTNDGQWGYDERYLDAKVVSTKEQGANRAMHRGTLDTFLFGGGIHEPSAEEIAKARERAKPNPPYQIAPPGYRPHTATGKKSISNTSFDHNPTYTRAAVVANAESVENRMMHRGTISEWDDFGAGPMYFDRMVADSRGPK